MAKTVAKTVAGIAIALAIGAQMVGVRAAGAAGATPFAVTSPAFADGGPLPTSSEYGGGFGCHGSNRAPTLTWRGVPAGVRSFALAVVDPDAAPFAAGGWVHDVVYDIPAAARALDATTLARSTSGTNSFGTRAFGGPCPPAGGQPHHYVFTLYVLGVARLSGHALTRDALLRAMAGHIVGAASIVGTFSRL